MNGDIEAQQMDEIAHAILIAEAELKAYENKRLNVCKYINGLKGKLVEKAEEKIHAEALSFMEKLRDEQAEAYNDYMNEKYPRP